MEPYVHGYTIKEAGRLSDQANTLTHLLHKDTHYKKGETILEAGCGIGSQTVILAENSPDSAFVSMDIEASSLEKAKHAATENRLANVKFNRADIYDLPFETESFDHVFVCFVLEHLKDPVGALTGLRRVLKKRGTLTVIEGDHGSFYCHPRSDHADRCVQCLVDIQAAAMGDALIGRQLYPLLCEAGFQGAVVSPRMVYVDGTRPGLVEGFSKKTFIAMVEGVKEKALSMNLMDEALWKTGIRDLYRATEKDGIFCYTFFKGLAVK